MRTLKFFEKLDLVDKIISESNSKGYDNAVKELTSLLHDDVVKRYFYEKIDSEEWAKPLFENGLLDKPYGIERKGDLYLIPFWPESSYLAKVAEKAPDIVTNIIVNIPETDNERIHDHYVLAAINMPIEYAEIVAKAELEWCRKQIRFSLNYPDNFGKLFAYLAKNEKLELAKELAAEILEIESQTREIGKPDEEGYHRTTDVVARFSSWEYERILKNRIPDLIDNDRDKYNVFKLLCSLLSKSLEIGYKNLEPPNDHSYIWRQSVEDHKQNLGDSTDIKAMLVSAVRDSARGIISGKFENLGEIVRILDNEPWYIFHRIAIYCISKHPEVNLELTKEQLLNKSLFENIYFQNDYYHLAKSGFKYLGDNDKENILSWIEQGPDIERYKSAFKENKGQEPNEEQIQKRIRYWQREKLEQFSDDLPENWKLFYRKLLQEYGEAEHPEFSSYTTSWTGPTSPKTTHELREMSVDEIVEYLRSWEPPKSDMDDSPEGLSRAMTTIVAEEPERFINEIEKFQRLEPPYIRGVLDGFRNLKEGIEFDWGKILDLCKWVVDQPREKPDTISEYSDIDPGWVWARKSIASLIKEYLKSGSHEIPFEYRIKVWDIYELLTHDPDPIYEEEVNKNKSSFDPFTLSINTVRGEAMHGVIDYGLWVYRHIDEEKKNFDIAPELKVVLDFHIDVKNDPSLAIRSVYGQRFPWINLMDNEWGKNNWNKVFDDSNDEYWNAAWSAYLKYSRPYDEVFKVIKEVYTSAVQRMQNSERDNEKAQSDNMRLAEHLFVFYWRGILELNDDLIQSFYENCTKSVAGRVIDFLGRSLNDFNEKLSDDLSDRLIKLFEWRKTEAEKTGDFYELSEFFWWFASGKFDEEWAFTQLKYVLQKETKLHSLYKAAEKLIDLTENHAKEVLDCVALMINKDDEQGTRFSLQVEIKKILENVLKFGDTETKEYANDLIHEIGSKGHLEFRELLTR